MHDPAGVAAQYDLTDVTLDTLSTQLPPSQAASLPPLRSHLLASPAYPSMVANFLRNLREGRAGVVQVIAVRGEQRAGGGPDDRSGW
jgi:hypothetical protein